MKKNIFLALGFASLLGFYAVWANEQKMPPKDFPPNGFPPKDFANGELPPPPPDGAPNGIPGEFGHIPDEKEPELTATEIINQGSKSLEKLNLASGAADKSVLLVQNNARAFVEDLVLSKNGGDTSNGGQSNFYGLNAAVIAKGKSSLSLKNVTVTSDADGANAVFSTGEGTFIEAENIKIRTEKNSSRGLDSTYGGKIIAKNVDIETKGAHSAAFATDRGEGIVIADGGMAVTNGEGSPLIYSTGNITVKNLSGTANGSEIAVIEGKNSITIEDSVLSGGTKSNSRPNHKETSCAVMLYQSMSGDANRGTSVFTAVDSTLKSTSDGVFFYVTNTEAIINLNNTVIENPGEVLLQASGNESERGWGRRGANGGKVIVNTKNQVLVGDIFADEISEIKLNFGAGTSYKGALNKMITTKCVNLKLSKKAQLELTADSYVNEFVNDDKSCKNIISNGYTLYYNKKASQNAWLKGRTIRLADGGKIQGVN